MYDRILIPVDGSDEATQAARRGLGLAAAFDASVSVIHVIEAKRLRLTRTAGERDRLRERGEEILAGIEQLAAEGGQPITTTLTEGTPAAAISSYAAEQDADLILIGRQGMTGPRKRLLGGVTEQVIYRSDIPICVVPYEESPTGTEHEYDRILIPTDGSETAEAATSHAVAVAQRYDAGVHTLNVVDLQSAGGMFNVGGLEKSFVDRLEASGQEAVDGIRTAVEQTAGEMGVETAVRRSTSLNGVANGIENYVTDQDIDLIVIGSHGQSNLRSQLLGSVTSALLRTVDVPVVVVKRDQ